MRIDVVVHSKNPLDLPEIRDRIALFLTRKDCITCMRVSREWFKDFLKPVWQTIDLAKDTKFVKLDRSILDKYGHCVRRVLNILTFDHVRTLQHHTFNRVQAISLDNHIDSSPRSIQNDFIRRCSSTLTEMEFRGIPFNAHTTMRDQVQADRFYLDISMLMSYSSSATPVSHLESLTLKRVCISYEGFVTLLCNSPGLRKLSLFKVAVINHAYLDTSHGSNVTCLQGSLAEIVLPDPTQWVTSLLHLFPRLESWHLTAIDRPDNWGEDRSFRHELARSTPHLKKYQFDHVPDSNKLSDFFVDCIHQPESCTFSAKNLCVSLIFGLTTHYSTLTSITITDTCTDSSIMRWVYLIPKMCLHLTALSMENLTLEMGLVEEHPWQCKDLRDLRMQFKGLKDIKTIEECLASVCLQRRLPGCRIPKDSISFKVSQHLLQFCKLTNVWLGSKVFYLPIPSAPAATVLF